MACCARHRSHPVTCAPDWPIPSTTPPSATRLAVGMDEFAIPPEAVARAIAFAIEQPHELEIGDITIRPTIQGYTVPDRLPRSWRHRVQSQRATVTGCRRKPRRARCAIAVGQREPLVAESGGAPRGAI
jgi:hypothetical protein